MFALFTDILQENILHVLVGETAIENQALEGMNYLGEKLISTWYILFSKMMAQQICPRCIQYGGNAKTKMRIRSGKVW
jgi:hypothetical protein